MPPNLRSKPRSKPKAQSTTKLAPQTRNRNEVDESFISNEPHVRKQTERSQSVESSVPTRKFKRLRTSKALSLIEEVPESEDDLIAGDQGETFVDTG